MGQLKEVDGHGVKHIPKDVVRAQDMQRHDSFGKNIPSALMVKNHAEWCGMLTRQKYCHVNRWTVWLGNRNAILMPEMVLRVTPFMCLCLLS